MTTQISGSQGPSVIKISAEEASALVHRYEYILVDHRRYIQEHGVDPEEITNWRWK